jgi:Tol biopolymer transport system component
VAGGALAWSRAVGAAQEGTPAAAEIVVRRASGEERVVAGDAAYRAAPAWSPDGRSLAYVGVGGLSIVADGAAEPILPCRPPACLGVGAPAWSPDGSALAFGWLGSSGDGLAVLDVGEREPEIVADLVVDGQPSWSPDGTSIAVVSSDRIVVLDVELGNVTRSLRFPGRLGDRVSWSPDGRSFVVDGSAGGQTGVFTLSSTGGDPTLLSGCPDDGCADIDPTWSINGSHVVFTRARCDLPGGDCFTGDLYVVPVDGGAAEPLVAGPGLECCAASGSSVVP